MPLFSLTMSKPLVAGADAHRRLLALAAALRTLPDLYHLAPTINAMQAAGPP